MLALLWHYGDRLLEVQEERRSNSLSDTYVIWPNFSREELIIREIKIHVYGIRQTANVSWKFLRIENKQIKTVQNDSCGQNWHKTTYFCVEAINSKRKTRGKLGHVVQIHVCRLA